MRIRDLELRARASNSCKQAKGSADPGQDATVQWQPMASDSPAGGRKRPHEAPNAQEAKRRQIQQAAWGLREVLGECGLLEFAGTGGGE